MFLPAKVSPKPRLRGLGWLDGLNELAEHLGGMGGVFGLVYKPNQVLKLPGPTHGGLYL